MGEKKVQEYFVFSVTALKVTKKRERERRKEMFTHFSTAQEFVWGGIKTPQTNLNFKHTRITNNLSYVSN